MNVPRELRTKDIGRYIKDTIFFDNAKDFDSLDSIDKDYLVGLGLQALGGDVDLILGSDANHHFSKYLLTFDPDSKIELMKSILEIAHEKFSPYFNEMFSDVREEILSELLYDGKRRHIDQSNGEVRYL